MFSLRLHLEFAAKTCDEAAATLRSLVGPVRSEAGCTATRLLASPDESCKLSWIEEWRDVEAFEDHLRGPSFRTILSVIELAAAPPVVEIDEVTSRRGFDLVEEILGSGSVNSTERRRT